LSLGVKLEFRQGQSLVITPQLQQAIKLLQLSNIELEAYVEAELEKNPLLARDDGPAAPDAEQPEAASEHLSEVSIDRLAETQADSQMDARHDDLYADASPGDRATGDAGEASQDGFQAGGAVDWSKAGSGGSFDTDADGFEERLAEDKSLADHLHDQLNVTRLNAAERAIAAILIDAVDEGGYLRADLDELAERLGCELALIEGVLTCLQGFEPTGIFARSVAECLALQLKERDRFDPAMQALVANLDLLARRDLAALRKACDVDDEDLREMIAELKALTPRPGAAFGGEMAAPVQPDIHVRESQGGLWHVELNTDTLPRLLVDQRYHARVATGARTEGEKVFVSDCLAQANWLIRSLDQRAKTVLKVASEIVRQQDGFLAYGVEHLRPLNLKTVADAIGMHESTVSRVTSNKYMATPRGLFELKFFFTASIQSSSGGEAHSAEAVRHKIKVLIDAEASGPGVLSDDRIVEILQEAGVDIARRTVAKYREAMRIPSSVERRRMLKEAC
jgi:RNA polymerase sigma-54 factor